MTGDGLGHLNGHWSALLNWHRSFSKHGSLIKGWKSPPGPLGPDYRAVGLYYIGTKKNIYKSAYNYWVNISNWSTREEKPRKAF